MVKLKVGDIIHLYQEQIYPPKNKYHVCVCLDAEEYWFFLINSHARKMYECTRAILPQKYLFLKHESYISCSRVLSESKDISIQKVLGHLDSEDLKEVLSKTQTSRTLTKRQKDRILSQVLQAISA